MKKKKIFQFTLTLKNVNEKTDDLENTLYEANCDDALPHFSNGMVYLNFDREALSLEEAVISAIKDVKSASIEIDVASVSPGDLVTESEISKRLDMSRQTVSLWILGKRRQSFPHPIMRLSEKSSLWRWSEVTAWLYQNKIIRDKSLVDEAYFIANMNAALDECDKKTRKIRHQLLARIAVL